MTTTKYGFHRRTDGPRWLYGAPGRLRVPWRLALFGGSLLLAEGIAEALIAPLFGIVSRVVGEPVAAYPFIMLAGVWAAIVIALRVVDDAGWSKIGLGEGAWHGRLLGLGAALGALLIGVTALLLSLAGYLHFAWAPLAPGDVLFDSVVLEHSWSAWNASALRLFVLLAPAALWEELMFRGYLWTVAEEAAGSRAALWCSSLAFGAVHLTNPGAGIRTVTLVVLAGLCLGVLRQRTASLPAAWAAHLAWNWTMAAVLHVPVSGVPLASPGYRAIVNGPPWLTGGVWGPEGGAVAAMVLVSALFMAWKTKVTNQRTEA